MRFTDLSAQYSKIQASVDARIADVLDHGHFILGPEVTELEHALSGFCGAAQTVTCASGTDALLLPLMGWGVGEGDAVFVPTFTFAATAEVVALRGATPVFVDVQPDTYNIDPRSLASALKATSHLRPAAVIAVDLFGLPADYDALRQITSAHEMRLIADAAQSFGASSGGSRVGTMGDVTATSFFPAKPLGCYGDGGAILTDDAEFADTLRSLRVHGQRSNKYDNVRIGTNSRLDTMQAAILLEKLKIFPRELEGRSEVAEAYGRGLDEEIEKPRVPVGTTSAWAQYTVQVRDRDLAVKHLRERGIPTAIYYSRPLHLQPAYASFPQAPSGLKVAEELVDVVLSLPMHPYLTEDEISLVTEELNSAVARAPD